MSEAIALDLVTPEKLVSSEKVDMVVVPGERGDFGVRAGHTPLISSLRTGVVRVYEGEKVKERLLITGGFAEVTPERCTILAEEVFDFDDTSVEAAKARRDAAKKAHDKAKDDAEKTVHHSEAELADAIIDAFIREQDLV